MKISPAINRVFRLFVIFIGLGAVASCGATSRDSAYSSPELSVAERNWEEAHQLERDGKGAVAIARYHSLCMSSPPYERACYDECRLQLESELASQGRACAIRYISTHTNSALAPVMVKALARSYREADAKAEGAQALMSLAGEVVRTDVWDSVLYAAASFYQAQGLVEKEEGVLLDIVNQGRWGSQLWDNAIWRVIAIQREKNNDSAEEKYIREMLSAREDSRLIASYNSPLYDDALFRLGEIYLLRGDEESALKTFTSLSEWETSRLRDDAVLANAKIQFQSGELKKACELLLKIVDDMPDSSSVRKARILLGEWECAQ